MSPVSAPQERSARKPKGQGAERREEILEHALHLFAQHGVHSVSTRRIAESVGVSQPTLYAYFPTRDAILDEVCARAFQELTRRMTAIDPSLPTRQRLESLALAYIRFGLEQPDAYRIAFMIESAHGEPKKGPVGRGAFSILREAITAHMGEGHPQIEVISQSVWAAQHGLVSLLIARAGFPWVERDALIAWHLRAVSAGVPGAR